MLILKAGHYYLTASGTIYRIRANTGAWKGFFSRFEDNKNLPIWDSNGKNISPDWPHLLKEVEVIIPPDPKKSKVYINIYRDDDIGIYVGVHENREKAIKEFLNSTDLIIASVEVEYTEGEFIAIN